MAYKGLDSIVKDRLRTWPQSPPGLHPRNRPRHAWLRGRPVADLSACHPFLDIFAVEACGSLQNLLDKRSRFTPSTHSLLAVCPVPWLLAPVDAADRTPRWKATGVLRYEPALPVVLPVRDLRVLYALKRDHYAGFARHQVPHAHEFFVPMDSITAKGSDSDPALCWLIARATAQNFLCEPEAV
jgi:hypothetical protein